MALPNKLRERLAQQFIDSLKEGRLPWKACWQRNLPENGITGKAYRGANSFLLSLIAELEGYSDSRWCTFRQASEKGWHIQKGAKGVPVEYWAYYDSFQKKLLPWSEAKSLLEDSLYAERYLQLRSRTYTVFNAHQIEGIPELPIAPSTNIDAIRKQRDTLLQNMNLKYKEEGIRAFYSPSKDMVTLPPESSFNDEYSYACTFLHECGHATGHPTRLNRDLSGGFGSDSYAKEELRAEIASAFTAQAIGLQLTDQQLQAHMDHHKAYIQSWSEDLENAPEELFRAIKDAERISDYLIEKGEFEISKSQEQEQAVESPESQIKGDEPAKSLDEIVAEAIRRTNQQQKEREQRKRRRPLELER